MNTVYYLHAQAHGNRFNLILFDPPPKKKGGKKQRKKPNPPLLMPILSLTHYLLTSLPCVLQTEYRDRVQDSRTWRTSVPGWEFPTRGYGWGVPDPGTPGLRQEVWLRSGVRDLLGQTGRRRVAQGTWDTLSYRPPPPHTHTHTLGKPRTQ